METLRDKVSCKRSSTYVTWCVTEPQAKATATETANSRSPPFLRSRPSEKETFLEETTLSYCQESNDEIRRDDMSLSRNLVDSGCDLGRVEKPVLRRSSPIISRQHGLVSWIEEIIETSQPSSKQHGFAEHKKGPDLSTCEAPPTRDQSPLSRPSSCSSVFPEFPVDSFKTCSELEQENAHFVVVDMVLDILETAKWTLSTQQQQQQQLQQKNHPQAYPSRCTLTRSRTKARPKSSAISSSKNFEDGPAVRLMPPDSLRRAEWLAQQLVMEFKRNWLPSHKPQRGRRSLRSSLQELPGTGGMSPSGGCLRDGMKLRACVSGSVSWTPPRFQLILQIQPTLRRSEVMALQNYLCAGCGTEVEPKYIKKLLYCTYLNRYFCECCHSSSEAVIPARVLANWDFSRFPVSDFSKHLLDSVWHQPLFDLSCLVETLRVKELEKLSGLLKLLSSTRRLLKNCKYFESVIAEVQFPVHLLCDWPPLISMDDLHRLKKGQLINQTKAVLQATVSHAL